MKMHPIRNQENGRTVCFNVIRCSFVPEFKEWKSIFEFLTELIEHNTIQKTIIIIDEFPYIAKEDPSIKSALQTIIDHKWKNMSNVLLILCGSSVSFMIN